MGHFSFSLFYQTEPLAEQVYTLKEHREPRDRQHGGSILAFANKRLLSSLCCSAESTGRALRDPQHQSEHVDIPRLSVISSPYEGGLYMLLIWLLECFTLCRCQWK